ncbi:AAA family ATPase [Sulfurimonas sp.]|uniref:AAA family ATPase n=1 Tax=Sulfurimonas sp. TaxID=2022749 RepID=UPI00260ABF0E|nr:AAA family ATPase [Sulfurimonas sp.]
MKILSLKSLNINSLKGKTEIDFAQLTQENALFAITGPTGSGKSTLLDIISCALYGRTARLKNPNDLMSKNCGEAYCEVEFEIKGRVYRSSWKQRRARKKHDGAFQSATMELVDLQEDKILPLKSREVPKKIEELSGLDFSRFTQSMLLAQGSFDAFLKADEKERSVLLEKITGTQIYAEISKAVFDKHRLLQQEMDGEQRVLDSIELLDKEVVAQKQKELDENIAKKIENDKELHKLNRALHWSHRLVELQSNIKKYESMLAEVIKEKEENRGSFERLSLAQRALNVFGTFSSYKQLHESLQASRSKSVKLADELTLLDEELQKSSAKYVNIQEMFEKEEREYSVAVEKIKAAREIKTKEEENRIRLVKEEKLLQSKEEALQKAKKSFVLHLQKQEDIQTQIAMKNEYLQKHRKDEELFTTLGIIEQNIKIYRKLLNKKESDIQENDKSRVLIKSLKERQKISIEHIEEIKRHIETLREKLEREQLLKKYEADRELLVAGEACFLCGATEHPYAKTIKSVSVNATKEMLQKELKELQAKEKDLQELELLLALKSSEVQKRELEIENIDKEIQEQRELFEKHSFDVNDTEIDEKYQELIESKNRYVENVEALKKLEKELNVCNVQKGESQTQLRLFTKEIEVLQNSIKALQENINAFVAKRVEVLNVADLDVYEQEVSTKYKAAQKEEQESRAALHTLTIKKQERQEAKKSLELQIEEESAKLEVLKKSLEELYEQNGFSDEEELKSAMLETQEREELTKFCNDIENRYKEIQTLYKETEHQLQEHKKEPLTQRTVKELEILLALLTQKADALQESIGSSKKELELNQENSNRFQKRIAALQEKKEAFGVWVKLNELVGSADGTKFKKFAQGITLDQLISLANQHLEVLSPRYTLARNQEKLLELEIVDSYQGNVERPVSTLSGGESFIVSLALALGLSELASQKIAIDSLFLDEGFGTLDTESLETALNALNLLQTSGKMVGVISHVKALKERIPLQIRVVPNGDGTSRVEVD